MNGENWSANRLGAVRRTVTLLVLLVRRRRSFATSRNLSFPTTGGEERLPDETKERLRGRLPAFGLLKNIKQHNFLLHLMI